MRHLLLSVLFLLAGTAFATGEINVLTDLQSPFPPGCVAVELYDEPASSANELYREDLQVPSVEPGWADATVRVTIWRTGCHDDGYSVVMVNLKHLGGGPALVPKLFAEAGEVDLPMHVAQLLRHPASGNVGASGNELHGNTTYMLGVDPFSVDGNTVFTPADYNDWFTLELSWADYINAYDNDASLFDIPPYEPAIDPPQTDYPVLHGRMTGHYIVPDLPRTGLVLEIGEQYQPDGDDTNVVNATIYTYLDGHPFWVAGSLGDITPGFDLVMLDMYEYWGGEFFSQPGSYSESDIEEFYAGNMSIEALDCNTLLVGFNFQESGLGAGEFLAHRLVRVAGYDCNPWE